MPDFSAFVRNPPNRIARSSWFTDDLEGFVGDGADGGQVALWTCRADKVSKIPRTPRSTMRDGRRTYLGRGCAGDFARHS
jgi:hypothetical protein